MKVIRIIYGQAPIDTMVRALEVSKKNRETKSLLTPTPHAGYYYVMISHDGVAATFMSQLRALGVRYAVIENPPPNLRFFDSTHQALFVDILNILRSVGADKRPKG